MLPPILATEKSNKGNHYGQYKTRTGGNANAVEGNASAVGFGGKGFGGNGFGGAGFGGAGFGGAGGSGFGGAGGSATNTLNIENGLTGRMVPDVSMTSPNTSTSCQNGFSGGASGNGWGGIFGFFISDENV